VHGHLIVPIKSPAWVHEKKRTWTFPYLSTGHPQRRRRIAGSSPGSPPIDEAKHRCGTDHSLSSALPLHQLRIDHYGDDDDDDDDGGDDDDDEDDGDDDGNNVDDDGDGVGELVTSMSDIVTEAVT